MSRNDRRQVDYRGSLETAREQASTEAKRRARRLLSSGQITRIVKGNK